MARTATTAIINTATEITASKTKEQVIAEAQRIEESSMYSSKGHFAAARIWTNFHMCIGLPMVILSVIAGASLLKEHVLISGVLSIIVAVLSGIMTFLNPNERASKHFSAGNHYDSLQVKARIFRTIDCWREPSDQVLTDRLATYLDHREKLKQGSPQIPYWAYQMAKRGIEAGEAIYEVDKKSDSPKSDIAAI
ncbi:MAG: SLATT domain-containing protein [Patescibacteria group bacterium]